MAKKRLKNIKKVKNTAPKEDFYYASVGLKIKAFLTDAFMLVMPIMYLVFYFVMDGREDFQANMLLGWVYILLPLVLIQTIFMAKTGQTPGYRAYDILLVDNSSKQIPSFGIVLFRNLTAILSLFTLVGWMLMFFRKDNRNLHDILSATTLVLKSKNT
jgi:uncharacterized RDD family membrane protein YckC